MVRSILVGFAVFAIMCASGAAMAKGGQRPAYQQLADDHLFTTLENEYEDTYVHGRDTLVSRGYRDRPNYMPCTVLTEKLAGPNGSVLPMIPDKSVARGYTKSFDDCVADVLLWNCNRMWSTSARNEPCAQHNGNPVPFYPKFVTVSTTHKGGYSEVIECR